MKEIWKDIRGYKEYYQVSSTGRIRSLDRMVTNKRTGTMFSKGVVKKTYLNDHGYPICSLVTDGRRRTKSIHRLVAMAFIPNPKNKRDVNHKDLNKENNNIDNLEWMTRSENMKHAYDNGAIKSLRRKIKLGDLDVVYIRLNCKNPKEYDYYAKVFNVSRVTIWQVMTRRTHAEAENKSKK